MIRNLTRRNALLVARTLTLAATALCAILAHSTNSIAAGVLPETATGVITLFVGNALDTGTTVSGTPDVSNTLANGVSSATASVTSQPVPRVDGSVSVTGPLNQAFVSAHLTYFFSVVGPDDVVVPVIISSNGGVSPSIIGNVTRSFLSSNVGTPLAAAELLGQACQGVNCGSFGGNAPSFSYVGTKNIVSNSRNSFDLLLDLIANTFVTGLTSEAGSGFIAAFLTIDPAFARAGEFSLAFSPGIGNPPAVTPLPAALPLFGTGLGFMGLMGWWRKRRAGMAA